MKTVLAILLALVASSSFAAAVPLSPGPGIAGTASGFTTASSFTGQFSAASFNSNFTTNVAGKAVTMPATMRMAANAGRFAVQAVKLNPTTLIGAAVAAWLLEKGLEYIDGQWRKRSSTVVGSCASPRGTVPPPSQSITLAECRSFTTSALNTDANGYSYSYVGDVVESGGQVKFRHSYKYGGGSTLGENNYGGWNNAGVQTQPATDADFAQAETAPLPDPVADELAKKGVALPLDYPQFNPPYKDEPLGEPYIDPVTGKRYRDQARITPSSDAKTADVQATKQEVDEAGNPKKQEDGQTDKPPEEQTDFCKKNPDASSCKPFDEAPDTELQKKDNPFSLNPVSGFGADNASCPAPQQLFTRGGQQITWDWGKFCTFAQGIRPLIIGFAWLSAIMIVVAVGRRNA